MNQGNIVSDAERSIVLKLDYFHRHNKIPHIIFYGPTNSAKDMIVSNFINRVYSENMFNIKHNVLFVSCSGKGIKFIRDEIKTFAKMHIHCKDGVEEVDTFKTVVLMNADFLTDDAQSALRRSIELFSYNTRFFLLVENKSRLLKPILSRFCEIYVPPYNNVPLTNANVVPLTNANTMKTHIIQLGPLPTQRQIIDLASLWYESGFSSYDFVQFIEGIDNTEKKIHVQFLFHKLKTEYRCEKLFLWTLLDFYLFRDYNDFKKLCSHVITE